MHIYICIQIHTYVHKHTPGLRARPERLAGLDPAGAHLLYNNDINIYNNDKCYIHYII